MRARRRALSSAERQVRAAQVCSRLIQSSLYKTSKRIAAYIAMDGELDVSPLLQRAWRDNKSTFLPVLVGPFHNHLRFVPYAQTTAMRCNRFGIPEPVVARGTWVAGIGLDLVLVPLVGFDATGTRLGMGGGYYDRSFAFRNARVHWHRPVLVGIAFDVQRVDALPRNSWDVALDAVATESGLTMYY